VESVVVYRLRKHARFTVHVAAFNRAGEGVRSEPVVAGRLGYCSLSPANSLTLMIEDWVHPFNGRFPRKPGLAKFSS